MRNSERKKIEVKKKKNIKKWKKEMVIIRRKKWLGRRKTDV